ncbi:MAG: FliM/FliN family flagellar motor switch protein [Pseudomonadota bacterium]
MSAELHSQFPAGAPSPDRDDDFRLPSARGLLSAAEIEMLLRPEEVVPTEPEPVAVNDKPVAEFAGSSEKAQLLADAEALASRLTLTLRTECKLKAVLTARSASLGDFQSVVHHLPGAPVLIAFSRPGRVIEAALALPASLADAIITIACGGHSLGHAQGGSRAFTTLDRLLLEQVLRPLAGSIDPEFEIACVETDPAAVAALLVSGEASIAQFEAAISGRAGQVAIARLAPTPIYAHEGDRTRRTPVAVEAVLTARIARLQVPVSRLADLKPGSLLLLGLPADQPVEILSGGRDGALVAEGQVGRKGNRIAVRIDRRTAAIRG